MSLKCCFISEEHYFSGVPLLEREASKNFVFSNAVQHLVWIINAESAKSGWIVFLCFQMNVSLLESCFLPSISDNSLHLTEYLF